MTTRTSDIVPGARIVLGRTIHCAARDLSDLNVEFDVVHVEQDEKGLFFVNKGGRRRDFEPNRDPYSNAKLRMPGEVIWTRPVPEATDEELRRLVIGAHGAPRRNSSDKAFLLHVQCVHGDIAYAVPVLPRADGRSEGSIYPRDDATPDYVVGNAAIWSHMVRIHRKEEDWALRQGALVVAWTGKAYISDGLPVHTVCHMIEVMTCSVERLGQWLPENLSPGGYHTGPFHDVLEIEDEEERARVRQQANEALVLGYVDGDSRGGTLLGTSGITFHHVDDAISSMFGAGDPPPGLWVAHDCQWVGEGENVEIDFDLLPATMGDIERFGWDADGIRTEIAGYLGVPDDQVPEDICAQIVAQAHEFHALETWEEGIRGAWTEKAGLLSVGDGSSHMMRYPLQDFISMARSRLCAIDGLEMAIGKESMALRWPGASIEMLADGETIVTLPTGVSSYPRGARIDRKDMFQPLVDWLTSRPENTERTRPDDPRTVVPVRNEA